MITCTDHNAPEGLSAQTVVQSPSAALSMFYGDSIIHNTTTDKYYFPFRIDVDRFTSFTDPEYSGTWQRAGYLDVLDIHGKRAATVAMYVPVEADGVSEGCSLSQFYGTLTATSLLDTSLFTTPQIVPAYALDDQTVGPATKYPQLSGVSRKNLENAYWNVGTWRLDVSSAVVSTRIIYEADVCVLHFERRTVSGVRHSFLPPASADTKKERVRRVSRSSTEASSAGTVTVYSGTAPTDCDPIEYPVCIYRSGGIGSSGPLGCGIHEPAVAFLIEPGTLVIPGEGVRSSNNYSAYEILAFDALGRRVYSAVAHNSYNGVNVEIPVNSADFRVDYPCAADTGLGWCGCFSAPETPCDTTPYCTPAGPFPDIIYLEIGAGWGSGPETIPLFRDGPYSWLSVEYDCHASVLYQIGVRWYGDPMCAFVLGGLYWDGSFPPEGYEGDGSDLDCSYWFTSDIAGGSEVPSSNPSSPYGNYDLGGGLGIATVHA